MRLKMSVKERKNFSRRKYIKLQLQIQEERKKILEDKLEDTGRYIKELWKEFNELKEKKDG